MSNQLSDQAQLLHQLLKIPSLSGDEGAVGDFVYAYLHDHGITVERQPVRGKTANIIAQVGTTGPRVLFVTHLDTINPTPAHWDITDPFVPHQIDDKIYGVGATDAKGIVTSLLGMLLDRAAQPTQTGIVMCAFVTEEETTGYGSQVLAKSLTKTEDLTVVIGEPTGLKRISLGTRGNAFIKLVVEGQEEHAAYPPTKADPWRVIKALDNFEQSLQKDFTTEWFTPSLRVTSIMSETHSLNTTPGTLVLTVDIRTSPPLEVNDFAPLRQKLEQFVTHLQPLKIDVQFMLPPIPGHYISDQHPLIQTAAAVAQQVTRQSVQLDTSYGSNDAIFFAQRGIPTINEVGPGEASRNHRPDEFVTLAEVEQGTKYFSLLAQTILEQSPQ